MQKSSLTGKCSCSILIQNVLNKSINSGWKFTTLLSVLMTIYSPAGNASELYCGVIEAKTPVTVVLDLSKPQYFYRKYRKTIPLRVINESEKVLVIAEKTRNSEAQFNLVKNECETYDTECAELSGFWQSYPVKLYPVALDGEGQISFEKIRKGTITTKIISKGSTEVREGPQAIQNLTVEYTITKFKAPHKIPDLNKLINTLSRFSEDEPCADIITSAHYTSERSFHLLTENLLAMDHHMTGYSPGMPYPLHNEGEELYYDLDNQKELDVDQIFLNFKKNKPDILALFFKQIMEESKSCIESNDKSEANCSCEAEYLSPTFFEQYFKFHIDRDKKKLGLALSFPRSLRPCWDEFQYLDTAKFEKYLNRKTALYSYLTSPG